MPRLLKRLLIFLGCLLIFTVALELFSGLYVSVTSKKHLSDVKGGFSERSQWKDLPYPVPIKDGVMKKWQNGEEILSYSYSVDNFTRRVSSSPENSPTNFLVFLGCSFTFGVGVKDNETLPSQTQLGSSNFRVYNYGVGGSSPVDVLFRLKSIDSSELKEERGLFLYVLFHDHLRRFHQRLEYMGAYGLHKTYYQKENREWKPLGIYREVFPVRAWLQSFVVSSYTFKLLRPFLSHSYSDAEIAEYVALIQDMKTEAEERKGKFAVLIWPHTPDMNLLRRLLDEAHVSYLDYSQLDLHVLTKGKANIPIDGHPTAETYRVLGQMAARDLASMFPTP